jgi:hypothetical protein
MEEAIQLHRRTHAGKYRAVGKDCNALTSMTAVHQDQAALHKEDLEVRLAEAAEENADAGKRKANATERRLEKEVERTQLAMNAATTANAAAGLAPLPGKWEKFVYHFNHYSVHMYVYLQFCNSIANSMLTPPCAKSLMHGDPHHDHHSIWPLLHRQIIHEHRHQDYERHPFNDSLSQHQQRHSQQHGGLPSGHFKEGCRDVDWWGPSFVGGPEGPEAGMPTFTVDQLEPKAQNQDSPHENVNCRNTIH